MQIAAGKPKRSIRGNPPINCLIILPRETPKVYISVVVEICSDSIFVVYFQLDWTEPITESFLRTPIAPLKFKFDDINWRSMNAYNSSSDSPIEINHDSQFL